MGLSIQTSNETMCARDVRHVQIVPSSRNRSSCEATSEKHVLTSSTGASMLPLVLLSSIVTHNLTRTMKSASGCAEERRRDHCSENGVLDYTGARSTCETFRTNRAPEYAGNPHGSERSARYSKMVIKCFRAEPRSGLPQTTGGLPA